MAAFKFIALYLALALLSISCTNDGQLRAPLTKAPSINLSRLDGEWYVPVRIPTVIDRDAGEMTVEFKPAGSQSFNMKWSFKSNSDAEGSTSWNFKSTLAHPNDTTSWILSPFWPLKFNYQVIEYSADYSWLVLGSNDRKNLWVLSRKKDPPAELLDGIFLRLKSSEFDVARIVRQSSNIRN
jgi:apolipoprotein D and lipocalin family protein